MPENDAQICALEKELHRAENLEREKVRRALEKSPEDRTNVERAIIAYSPWGTGQGCSCGG